METCCLLTIQDRYLVAAMLNTLQLGKVVTIVVYIPPARVSFTAEKYATIWEAIVEAVHIL